MEKIISVVLAVLLGIGGYYFYAVKEDLTHQIEELRNKDKISINSGVLAEVTQFTFSKLVTHFSYVHKKSEVLPLPWKGVYEYKWDYEYHFGVDIPKNWKWNFTEIEGGIISIDVPPLSQMNDDDIRVDLVDRIEPANGAHSEIMRKEVDAIALQRVKDVEREFLANPTIIEATRRSLESFFLNLLNERNPGMPVRGVKVNFKV